MIGELLVALAVATSTATVDGEMSRCEIEACPPAVLRQLWLAERRARITWKLVADDRARRVAALRRQLEERRAFTLEPTPTPCPPANSPSGWMAGACAVCALAGAGAAGGACALLSR